MKINTLSTLVTAFALATTLTLSTSAHAAPTAMPAPAFKQSAAMMSKSSAFKGIEVNGGTVSATVEKGKIMLMLSEDFMTPKTPAPHWQVVDTKGNAYLLNQLKIAGDKMNRSITLPSYIKNVAKVQIWCSFAEVNLGEATFAKAVTVK